MSEIKIIPFEYFTGAENMAYDEQLLEDAVTNNLTVPVFRLYGWSPACVSLGRNQNADFLDRGLLNTKGIDLVTRLTGGRALLHDKEVTYSFVCPQDYLECGQSVIASYKEISSILISAFEKMGVNLSLGGDSLHTKHDYCMLVSTGADLNYNGRKLVGSAQCRKKGYILQHGSILFDVDRQLIEAVFKEDFSTDLVVTIKEIFPKLSIEEFCNEFQDCVYSVLLGK